MKTFHLNQFDCTLMSNNDIAVCSYLRRAYILYQFLIRSIHSSFKIVFNFSNSNVHLLYFLVFPFSSASSSSSLVFLHIITANKWMKMIFSDKIQYIYLWCALQAENILKVSSDKQSNQLCHFTQFRRTLCCIELCCTNHQSTLQTFLCILCKKKTLKMQLKNVEIRL